MILAWFHWWWDSVGLDRAQVILSIGSLLVSIALAVLALWVAYRQMKIAEVQNDIVLSTMAKQPKLGLLARILHRGSKGWRCQLLVSNDGNASSPQCAFRIIVPKDELTCKWMIERDTLPSIEMENVPGAFSSHTGVLDKTVFPGAEMQVAEILISASFSDDVVIFWSLQSETQRFPDKGLREIRFSRSKEGHINWGDEESPLFLHHRYMEVRS